MRHTDGLNVLANRADKQKAPGDRYPNFICLLSLRYVRQVNKSPLSLYFLSAISQCPSLTYSKLWWTTADAIEDISPPKVETSQVKVTHLKKRKALQVPSKTWIWIVLGQFVPETVTKPSDVQHKKVHNKSLALSLCLIAFWLISDLCESDNWEAAASLKQHYHNSLSRAGEFRPASLQPPSFGRFL